MIAWTPRTNEDRVRQQVLAAITEAGGRGCDERDLARLLQLPSAVINARIGELLLAGYLTEEAAAWVATSQAVIV